MKTLFISSLESFDFMMKWLYFFIFYLNIWFQVFINTLSVFQINLNTTKIFLVFFSDCFEFLLMFRIWFCLIFIIFVCCTLNLAIFVPIFYISLKFFNSVFNTFNVKFELMLHSNVFSDISLKFLNYLLVNFWTARATIWTCWIWIRNVWHRFGVMLSVCICISKSINVTDIVSLWNILLFTTFLCILDFIILLLDVCRVKRNWFNFI